MSPLALSPLRLQRYSRETMRKLPATPPCTARVNPHIKITHAMGCQGQSCRLFCPWGQGYRGFENPRLFKDRPTDGKRSGCAAPFLNISVFHSAGIRMQITDCFASRSGMVLRIILLSLWSIIPRRNPYIISAAPALPCTQCPSQNNRIKFMRPMQPYPEDGLAITQYSLYQKFA